MIRDDENAPVPIDTHRLLDELNADPRLTLYLTGSRFAGTAHEASDFDFFCAADTPGVWEVLFAYGFEWIDGAEGEGVMYEDHPYTVAVLGKGDVQVQVVTSVECARRTRDLLTAPGPLRDADERLRATDKRQRTPLWVKAAELVALTLPPDSFAPRWKVEQEMNRAALAAVVLPSREPMIDSATVPAEDEDYPF